MSSVWLGRAVILGGLVILCVLAVFALSKDARSFVAGGRAFLTGDRPGSRLATKRCLSRHDGRVSTQTLDWNRGLKIPNTVFVSFPNEDDVAALDFERSPAAAGEAAGELDRALIADYGRSNDQAYARALIRSNRRVIRNVLVEWMGLVVPRASSRRIVSACIRTGK